MTLNGVAMGEVDTDVGPTRRSPSNRRPSPTSVQQLLELVHLQKQMPHKRSHTDKVPSSKSLAPLPAIGRKCSILPSDKEGDINRRRVNENTKRSNRLAKSFPPPLEGDDISEGVSPRQETFFYRDSPQTSSLYSTKREGTNNRLPPLTELQKAKEREIKAYELSQDRSKIKKRSANIEHIDELLSQTVPDNRVKSRLDRPRTSHGRRKILSKESMENYETQNFPQSANVHEQLGVLKDSIGYNISEEMKSRPPRPKSARGRRQDMSVCFGDNLYVDARPRAPSPPSAVISK